MVSIINRRAEDMRDSAPHPSVIFLSEDHGGRKLWVELFALCEGD